MCRFCAVTCPRPKNDKFGSRTRFRRQRLTSQKFPHSDAVLLLDHTGLCSTSHLRILWGPIGFSSLKIDRHMLAQVVGQISRPKCESHLLGFSGANQARRSTDSESYHCTLGCIKFDYFFERVDFALSPVQGQKMSNFGWEPDSGARG